MSKKEDKPQVVQIKLDANVLKLGDGYLAFAVVSGVRVAGGRRNTAYEALCSLFAVLAGQSGDNSAAAIAIEMLLAGYSMDDIPQLGAGK